jgi:hypothetical protein
MKTPFLILALATLAAAVTDSAYYRHHQRGTTTSLEADLVNREIGIDSSKKCIVGKLSTGVPFHGVCKEQDTVSFSGVLNVSGQTNLTSVKASSYNAGSVLFFGTGGLFSEDGANLNFNDATNTLHTLNLSMGDGGAVSVGASAGLKIGTDTAQRLGFFNSTPIVQPARTTDLRQALINLGLYATGGATPLDLNGGLLTADSIVSRKFYHDGAYLGTLTGVTTTVTDSIRFVRIGKQVTLKIPEMAGTSNSGGMSITGMPAEITPPNSVFLSGEEQANCQDGGAYYMSCTIVIISGTLTYAAPVSGGYSGFTTSGTKGTSGPFTPAVQYFTYTLQ